MAALSGFLPAGQVVTALDPCPQGGRHAGIWAGRHCSRHNDPLAWRHLPQTLRRGGSIVKSRGAKSVRHHVDHDVCQQLIVGENRFDRRQRQGVHSARARPDAAEHGGDRRRRHLPPRGRHQSPRRNGCVDEIANARMAKKQRMRWSPQGAHRVAVVRAARFWTGVCRNHPPAWLWLPDQPPFFHSRL